MSYAASCVLSACLSCSRAVGRLVWGSEGGRRHTVCDVVSELAAGGTGWLARAQPSVSIWYILRSLHRTAPLELMARAEISSIESTFPVKLHHKLVADRHIEVDTKYRASISSTGRRK